MGFSWPVVLIVGGHPESLAMYAVGLLAMGFQTVTAGNGEEGFARACAVHPDIVVADFTAPGDSCLELTRRLRGDDRTKDVAVIMLADQRPDAVQRRTFDGTCRWLIKPCMPDVLAFEIYAVLAARRVRREPP